MATTKRAVVIAERVGDDEWRFAWGIANIESFDFEPSVEYESEAIGNMKYRSPNSKEYDEKLAKKREDEHLDWALS